MPVFHFLTVASFLGLAAAFFTGLAAFCFF